MAEEQAEQVSVEALRGLVLKRLETQEHRLAEAGLTASFGAASDPLGDMGFLGNMIVDLILWSPIAAFFGGQSGFAESFNASALAAVAHGVVVLRDEETEALRNRKISSLYPEGRRKCALEESSRLKRRLQLIPRSMTGASFGIQAERMALLKMLAMLDQLERHGVQALKISEQEAVYDATATSLAAFTQTQKPIRHAPRALRMASI